MFAASSASCWLLPLPETNLNEVSPSIYTVLPCINLRPDVVALKGTSETNAITQRVQSLLYAVEATMAVQNSVFWEVPKEVLVYPVTAIL
jgi:hypothetical protein